MAFGIGGGGQVSHAHCPAGRGKRSKNNYACSVMKFGGVSTSAGRREERRGGWSKEGKRVDSLYVECFRGLENTRELGREFSKTLAT